MSDVTRMGEWSPENTGCRWVDGADGPALGARFQGDYVAKIGPVTVKKWTTTSGIITFEPGAVFEFVAEGWKLLAKLGVLRPGGRTATCRSAS